MCVATSHFNILYYMLSKLLNVSHNQVNKSAWMCHDRNNFLCLDEWQTWDPYFYYGDSGIIHLKLYQGQ